MAQSVRERRLSSVVYDVGEARYRPVTRAQFYYILMVLLLAMITSGLQAEIMGDAAPTIARKFNAELKLSWLASGGFMMQVCSLLILGKLYDFLEPKWILLFCSVAFLVGSLVSAMATTFITLVLGQVLAGLGRSGIAVGAILVLGVICPARPRRAVYVSIVTGAYGIMLKMAPVVSGLLLRDHSPNRWRWVFWVCVPFQATLVVMITAFPILRRRRVSLRQCKKLDFFGGAMQALGLAIFVLPLLMGTSSGAYAWHSPVLIFLYLSAPIIFLAFIYWEKEKSAERRFIPIDAILENRSISLLAIITSCSALIIAATTFFLPSYLQAVRLSSPLLSAAQMLPGIFLGSLMSLVVGKLLSLSKPRLPQYICIAGSLLQITAGIMFYFLPFTTSMLGFYLNSLVLGIGAGGLFAIGITLVLEIVPENSYGQAAAFMNTFTALGSLLGIAFQGIIVENCYEKFLIAHMTNIDTKEIMLSISDFLVELNEVQFADLHTKFRMAYHQNQRQASLLYASAGLLSLLASLALRKHMPRPINDESKEVNDQGAAIGDNGTSVQSRDLEKTSQSVDLSAQETPGFGRLSSDENDPQRPKNNTVVVKLQQSSTTQDLVKAIMNGQKQ